MFHYMDKEANNAIRSQPVWRFRVSKPPGDHPEGAYFTTLPPGTRNLGKRLFVRGCREKLEFVFHFSGNQGLRPLPGDRGTWIFYSPTDYPVEQSRQIAHGNAADWMNEQP